ncbi:hypothetical protein [Saccharomonospora xinjiangensis]|uniref:hypothetical protein n=1 Tax=Saccharomonospora xinjiangensis TaxID=75294 RepID=UPI0002EDEFA5|nr:hypothetical protein [Saccharomonospora xinjiangensis]
MLGFLTGASAVGAAWAIWALTPALTGPDTFTLNGTFTLLDGAIGNVSTTGCMGTGGYDDIAEGTSVTVYDEAGTVLATGGLIDSQLDTVSSDCVFTLQVAEVPDDRPMYQVEVSHRGKVAVDADSAKLGAVSLSLG